MSGAPEFDRALQLREEQLKRRIPGVPYRTAPIPDNMRDSGKVRIGCARVSFEAEPEPLPEAVAHAFEAHLEQAARSREPKPTKLADALLANGVADDAGDLIMIAMTIVTAFPLSAKRIREIAAHLRSLMGAA